MDWESIASGLLHDTVEDTNLVTFERIEEEFGATVRHIVEGETKVSFCVYCHDVGTFVIYIYILIAPVLFHKPAN